MRAAPKLLVSIQDADEAQLALEAGVDWIDLKNPHAGPLGAPDPETARQTRNTLGEHAECSVALGELATFDASTTGELLHAFPVAKIGLAQCRNSNWAEELRALKFSAESANCQLVPVVYADWQRAMAPPPEAVLEFAIDNECKFLLIDTFLKDSKRLLDLFTESKLRAFAEHLHTHQVKCVVAGQLSLEMALAIAGKMNVYAIAIRGAVCNENRKDAICRDKLSRWTREFSLLREKLVPNSLASSSANR